MRTCLIAAGSLVSFSSFFVCFADAPQDEPKPSFWMQKKLEYSTKILTSLANADFEVIVKTAQSMKALNQMEKWTRSGLPEYRAQLHIFENANEQLIRNADNKNLDGAALAYVQLTLSCVNCHKVVRDYGGKSTADAK